MLDQATPLLSADELSVEFRVTQAGGLLGRSATLTAVNAVSFDLARGDTLGVVGESGSGKSTLARALLNLVPVSGGEVRFNGEARASDGKALKAFRRHAQMIFQDPIASLSPRMTVGQILREPLKVHGVGDRTAKIEKVMKLVGLRPEMENRFPHEFSGGQAQRIGIARALVLEPDLIVADEPVSALDVSIQSQIINLMSDLKASLGLTMVFISHDLSVVRHVADQILVLYLGKVMEFGDTTKVYAAPKHPYTRTLLSSVPNPDPSKRGLGRRDILAGEPPSPLSPPSGCVFRTRCPLATERCALEVPTLREVEGRSVACHLAD